MKRPENSHVIGLPRLQDDYARPAIALHWLIGLAIAGNFALGSVMVDLPLSPDKLQAFSWHKWTGVTILMLALLRLAWRLTHPVLPPAGVVRWQLVAAEWAHRLLYLLMFAVPLSGWLMSSAKGVPTVYLGVWQLPDLVDRDRQLGSQLQDVHMYLNYLMAGIVLAHVAAALKHHWLDRDAVLSRMLPLLKPRAPRHP